MFYQMFWNGMEKVEKRNLGVFNPVPVYDCMIYPFLAPSACLHQSIWAIY